MMTLKVNSSTEALLPVFSSGRWAQRVGGNGVDGNGGAITMKSHYDSDSVIPFPNNKDIRGGEGPNSLDPRMQVRRNARDLLLKVLIRLTSIKFRKT